MPRKKKLGEYMLISADYGAWFDKYESNEELSIGDHKAKCAIQLLKPGRLTLMRCEFQENKKGKITGLFIDGYSFIKASNTQEKTDHFKLYTCSAIRTTKCNATVKIPLESVGVAGHCLGVSYTVEDEHSKYSNALYDNGILPETRTLMAACTMLMKIGVDMEQLFEVGESSSAPCG